MDTGATMTGIACGAGGVGAAADLQPARSADALKLNNMAPELSQPKCFSRSRATVCFLQREPDEDAGSN
jgi:hypothetical protein